MVALSSVVYEMYYCLCRLTVAATLILDCNNNHLGCSILDYFLEFVDIHVHSTDSYCLMDDVTSSRFIPKN